MTYALAGTSIIHELLSDEVIIANLDDGIYYSLRESGALIWQLLLAGHTTTSIQALFCEKYGKIPSLAPFIHQLVEERLLTFKENTALSPLSLSWPKAFEPPQLERYDEMKNLLMLDPIHEVDEQGWPSQR